MNRTDSRYASCSLEQAFGWGDFPVGRLVDLISRSKTKLRGYASRMHQLDMAGARVSVTECEAPIRIAGAGTVTRLLSARYFHESDTYWRLHAECPPHAARGEEVSPAFVVAFPECSHFRLLPSVPVLLANADRVPPLMPGDCLEAQVVMGACELSILPEGTRLAKGLEALDDGVREDLSDVRAERALTRLRAPVTGAWLRQSRTVGEFTIPARLRVRVMTPAGALDVVYFGDDAFALHASLRIGVLIEATGWIAADCASGEYRDAPKLDFWHTCRILRATILSQRFALARQILAPDILVSVDALVVARGSRQATGWLANRLGIRRNPSVEGMTVRYGTDLGVSGEKGRPMRGICVCNPNGNVSMFISPVVNEQGRACALQAFTNLTGHRLRIDRGFENWRGSRSEMVRMAPENVWEDPQLAQAAREANHCRGHFSHFPREHEFDPMDAVRALLGVSDQDSLHAALRAACQGAGCHLARRNLVACVQEKPGLVVILPGRSENAGMTILSACPHLPGIVTSAQVNAVHSRPDGLAREISIRGHQWSDALECHLADWTQARSLEPGAMLEFEMCAVLLHYGKEPENSDQDESTVEPARLSRIGSSCCYELQSRVEEVTETRIGGSPVYRLLVTLMSGEFPVKAYAWVSRSRCSGLVPTRGDRINVPLWISVFPVSGKTS